jgi:hypothetical protein
MPLSWKKAFSPGENIPHCGVVMQDGYIDKGAQTSFF